MATVDDLGRAAATKLRADVHVDVEAGLRRLHATAPAPSPDRRRWWAVAGAAAVLVIAVGAFVLIDRSPGQPSPVTIPGTVAPSTVVPSPVTPAPTTTVAAPSTAPSTLPGPSTSGAPTTAATSTTAAAPSTTVAAPAADFAVFAGAATIDLQPQLVPLPLPGCDPSCPSVVSMADGTIVAWDDPGQALLVLAPGAAAAQTVPVNAPGLTVDWVVAVGPDDVAYLFAHPAGGTIEDGLDLVAVPLTGPNAGTVVATAQDVGDMTGDTEWAPAATGLVAVSCCDAAPVRPSPTRAVSMGWVDSAGRPVVDTAPQLTLEIAGGTYAVRRSDVAAPFDVTDVIDTDVLRGMPLLAASPDGGVVIGTWPLDATTLLVGRVRPDGTRERFTGPPEGTYVLALDAFGAVVADGTTLARWQFPGFGAATELDAAALVDGASFATADDAVAAILAALRADDGCEVAPTAELVGTEPHGAGVVARFTARYGCDDSGAGRALAVALSPGADGHWTAGPAFQASLCRRGVSDGLCV